MVKVLNALLYLLAGVSFVVLMAGCSAAPAPVVIFDTPQQSITVRFDPNAGSGHSHPASVPPEQMRQVLIGVHVTNRDGLGLGGLLGKNGSTPAFLTSEIDALAPFLSEALRKASTGDLAAFYLTSADPKWGRVVTSGGVFVREGLMTVIVANFRTPSSSAPYEATAYEMDNRDAPLMPIARYKFTVSFSPEDASVPKQALQRRYVDPAKMVVVDLHRLSAINAKPTSTQ
jgi:hypothetical protein